MKWLKLDGLIEKTSLSRASIYRRMDANDLPKPVQIKGLDVNLWIEEEIDAWMEATVEKARMDRQVPK